MPRGAAASVAPVDRAYRRWRPAAAALGGRLGEEVDGDVDAVGVVLAGCGAARARVGAAAADDGDVVGIALGGDLAVGQGDRAGALLVLAASVDGGAEELGAAQRLGAGGVEDAVCDDRGVAGRGRIVAGALGRQVGEVERL